MSKKQEKIENHDDSSDEPYSDEDLEDESKNEYEKEDSFIASNESISDQDSESHHPRKRKHSESDDSGSDYDPTKTRKKEKKVEVKKLRKLTKVKAEPESEKASQEEEEENDEEEESYASEESDNKEMQTEFNQNRKPKIIEKIFNEEFIEREERKKREQREREIMETRQIDDIFEPADLIKNYETPVDKLVVKDDVPERLQLAYRHREEPKQDELVFEAEWICRQISLQSQLNEIEEKGLTGRIRKILEYLRNGKCEIMYIWTYKQHEFTVDASNNIGHYELKLSDMWMIYELDQEWKDVYNKFIAVGNLFDLVSNYHNNSQLIKNFKSQCFNHKHLDFLIDYGIHQIRKWVTFEELRIKLELINIKGTCYSLQGNKTVSYEVQRYGLSKHAESFTLTADQLAQNLLTNTKTNQLPQMNESPIELSKKCVIPEFTPFSDSSSAFQEIMNYMAYEYFNHPVVRKILYADLKSNVVVSTEPTDIGKNLTVYDYYYPSKRITFKKIDDKINRLWMLILESEKKGLITVSFKFDSVSQHHSKGVLRQRLNTFLLLSVDQT